MLEIRYQTPSHCLFLHGGGGGGQVGGGGGTGPLATAFFLHVSVRGGGVRVGGVRLDVNEELKFL